MVSQLSILNDLIASFGFIDTVQVITIYPLFNFILLYFATLRDVELAAFVETPSIEIDAVSTEDMSTVGEDLFIQEFETEPADHIQFE